MVHSEQSESDSIAPVLIRGALVGIAAAVTLQLNSDPDLWGHLRFGLDFWSTWTIPTADPYSFTSDRPWINHEWLFEVILALIYALGGTVALAMAASVAALATLAVARRSARHAGADGWRLDLLTGAVFLLGVAPLLQTMRPQVASLFMFVSLVALVREFDRGHHRALYVMPLLFLVWANTHGGWVVGGAVFATWVLLRVASGFSRKTIDGFRRKADAFVLLASIGVLSAIATFVNPYGLDLWRFFFETLRFERADIIEWGPLTSAPVMFAPWIATVAIAIASARRWRREELAYVAICTFLGVASFRVMRLVPFFSLAVLMLLGPLLTRPPAPAPVRIHARGWAGAVLISVICILSSTVGQARLGCLRPRGAFDVDDRAGSFLLENGAKGRLLVWFDWGEYVLWHLGPSLKVSIEGRRETVYSAATLSAHTDFYRNGPGARAYLERLAPDYVWLPNSLPVSTAIAQWGWHPIFETDTSTVWTRGESPTLWMAPRPITTPCFPDA